MDDRSGGIAAKRSGKKPRFNTAVVQVHRLSSRQHGTPCYLEADESEAEDAGAVSEDEAERKGRKRSSIITSPRGPAVRNPSKRSAAIAAAATHAATTTAPASMDAVLISTPQNTIPAAGAVPTAKVPAATVASAAPVDCEESAMEQLTAKYEDDIASADSESKGLDLQGDKQLSNFLSTGSAGGSRNTRALKAPTARQASTAAPASAVNACPSSAAASVVFASVAEPAESLVTPDPQAAEAVEAATSSQSLQPIPACRAVNARSAVDLLKAAAAARAAHVAEAVAVLEAAPASEAASASQQNPNVVAFKTAHPAQSGATSTAAAAAAAEARLDRSGVQKCSVRGARPAAKRSRELSAEEPSEGLNPAPCGVQGAASEVPAEPKLDRRRRIPPVDVDTEAVAGPSAAKPALKLCQRRTVGAVLYKKYDHLVGRPHLDHKPQSTWTDEDITHFPWTDGLYNEVRASQHQYIYWVRASCVKSQCCVRSSYISQRAQQRNPAVEISPCFSEGLSNPFSLKIV